MKNIFLFITTAVLITSCSVVESGFQKQRYTDFKGRKHVRHTNVTEHLSPGKDDTARTEEFFLVDTMKHPKEPVIGIMPDQSECSSNQISQPHAYVYYVESAQIPIDTTPGIKQRTQNASSDTPSAEVFTARKKLRLYFTLNLISGLLVIGALFLAVSLNSFTLALLVLALIVACFIFAIMSHLQAKETKALLGEEIVPENRRIRNFTILARALSFFTYFCVLGALLVVGLVVVLL